MSLFDEDSEPVTPAPAPAPIQTVSPQNSGTTVDSRFESAGSLLTHVEGMRWTVNYYSQVLGLDTPLSGLQLNLSPREQQYTLVKQLVIRVTTDLKPTQDAESGEWVSTGAANVFGGLKPNVGDMFLADVSDGREGLFKVTVSDKRSMLKEAIYAIEYQLVSYAEPVYLENLAAKTVRTVVFESDYINYGQSPFLEEEHYNDIRTLRGLYDSIMRLYFRSFLSNEYSALLLPGQELSIYDHFLTNAIQSVFSTFDTPEVRRIRRLNVDDDETMRGIQIWTVLINRDRNMMKECMKRMGGVYASRFTYEPMLEGFRWSGVRATVYPIEPVLSFDYQRTDKQKLVDEDIVLKPTMTSPDPEPTGIPLIKPVTVDDYYVFSQAFYDQAETGQSQLELEVNKFLDGKAMDQRVLIKLAETYTGWGGLERFYYGAMLLILISVALRGQ